MRTQTASVPVVGPAVERRIHSAHCRTRPAMGVRSRSRYVETATERVEMREMPMASPHPCSFQNEKIEMGKPRRNGTTIGRLPRRPVGRGQLAGASQWPVGCPTVCYPMGSTPWDQWVCGVFLVFLSFFLSTTFFVTVILPASFLFLRLCALPICGGTELKMRKNFHYV
jgi:hypothetical protein